MTLRLAGRALRNRPSSRWLIAMIAVFVAALILVSRYDRADAGR